MKKLVLLTSLIFSGVAMSNVYEFKLADAANKKKIDFSAFKDKYILVTNIATKCGYTSQLEKLKKISENKKLVIVGIPSNDFGSQTPESNSEVVEFCKAKFKIDGGDFYISEKSVVKGEKKIALIKYLQSQSSKKEINWNFEKYLIAPNEKEIKHFSSGQLDEIIKELI